MRGRGALFVVTAVVTAGGCSELLGSGDHSSPPHRAYAGERIESADAGPLCWDSKTVFMCVGNTYKQCAPAAGEGCVRCTCVLGNPNTESRWGTSGAWSDKGTQNLMGQPRVP